MPDEKLIYQFELTRKVEKTVEEKSTDESGAEITKKIKKTVDEPVTVVAKRPNRRQEDESEEIYAVEFSKFIRKGLLTKAMLANKYSDNGGLMSESDAKEYGKKLKELNDLRVEYTEKSTLGKDTKKKAKDVGEVGEKILALSQEILKIENRYQSLFELSAESKAESKRLVWYLLNLSFVKDGENLSPVFDGKDYEEKIDAYYEKEESPDEFYSAARNKLLMVYSIWMHNPSITAEQIEGVLKEIANGGD